VSAAELQVDLVRIDLATVVSTRIGETSKNLNRILEPAGGHEAVLLFDASPCTGRL